MEAIQKDKQRFFPRGERIPKVYLIHENDEWLKPLWDELNLLGVPFENWFLNKGGFDLMSVPPEGVFYSRVSASSHTRGHRYSVELAAPLLKWLEFHGRRVINGKQTVATEVSKADQYLLLQAEGIQIPRTLVANNLEQLIDLARVFEGNPFIVKPNRGGKGLGVQLFNTPESLQLQIENGGGFESLDGIYLLQEYIKPHNEEIVRMEFIGGQFYYAVRVDTSGGFELCPADGCEITVQFCPTTPDDATKPKFSIIQEFTNPDVPVLESFLNKQKIDIAGVEYLTNEAGERFVYDINTNTNYNTDAERMIGFEFKGMRKVAEYLQSEYEALTR